MAQYIYTMNRVGKVVPPKRHILRDISLSFFPGAKIGVLGLNGSGKSTLLRIMAGTDTDIEGEARPQPGIKVGLLPQEPQLDPAADVRTIVEESVKPVKDALARLEQVYALYSEPDADFDKLAAEQGQLEAFLASVDGHNLERQLDVAADALRLPPWDAKVSQLSGGERRRVALCRLLLSKPDMLLLDEPTNHLDAESVAWLEKYLEQYPSTVICVTHDRYFLDNVAGWILELDRGHGIPWQGNYSSWLEQKEQRLAQEEKQQEGLRAHARARARVGAREPEGAPGEEQGAPAPVRGAVLGRVPGAQRDQRDLHPAGTAARRPRDRGRRPAQGLRRAPADRRPLLPPAAGRHRRHHRAERRGQDDAVPHADRRREAGCGHDPHRPDRADRLRRPVARQARRHEDRLAGDLRRPGHHQGRQLRDGLARLRRAASTSAATSSSSRSASCRAASATACTSRSS